MISDEELVKYNKIVFDLYEQGKSMQDIKALISSAGFNGEDMQKILDYTPKEGTQNQQVTNNSQEIAKSGYNFFLIFTVFFYFKYLFEVKKVLTSKNFSMQTPLLIIPMSLMSAFLVGYTVLNGFVGTAFLFLKIPMILTFLVCFALYFWFKLTFSDAIFNLFDKQTDFMIIYLWNFIPIANLFLFKKVSDKVLK